MPARWTEMRDRVSTGRRRGGTASALPWFTRGLSREVRVLLNLFIFLNPPVLMGRWGIRPFRSLSANRGAIAAIPVVVVIIIVS